MADEPPREKRSVRAGWLRQGVAAFGLATFIFCLVQVLSSGPLDFAGWFGRSRREAGNVAVILDPGHGGADSGAVAQGVVEKDLNLDVAHRVAEALGERHVAVRLTREDDRFVPLPERVRMANQTPGAIFVSIHFNDSPSGSAASGIETYYSQTRETGLLWTSMSRSAEDCARESQRLADCIQGALVVETAAADRGIKERALYVTRRVLAPAVLVEGGFVSHPAEARRLGDPDYRQRLAKSMADGIFNYLSSPAHSAAAPAVARL